MKKYFLSILTAIAIMYLSLGNPKDFGKVGLINIPYFDKFVHFGMYFTLMLVFINDTKNQSHTRINTAVLALVPLAYGIIIEILQRYLTDYRSGSIYDALADAAGILLALLLWHFLQKPREGKVR